MTAQTRIDRYQAGFLSAVIDARNLFITALGVIIRREHPCSQGKAFYPGRNRL
jgi:hypothetical protein